MIGRVYCYYSTHGEHQNSEKNKQKHFAIVLCFVNSVTTTVEHSKLLRNTVFWYDKMLQSSIHASWNGSSCQSSSTIFHKYRFSALHLIRRKSPHVLDASISTIIYRGKTVCILRYKACFEMRLRLSSRTLRRLVKYYYIDAETVKSYFIQDLDMSKVIPDIIRF